MLNDLYKRARQFNLDAHKIFGKHETAKSRVIILTQTYKTLKGLSLSQDDLFRQAIRCVENELYRAAHVMAWAALMDYIENRIKLNGIKKFYKDYPNWSKYKTVEELREHVSEFQLIEACGKISLFQKNQMKAFHGLLNKRNECAHPSGYYPQLNESLGYISEIFQRISMLKAAKP